MERIRRNTTPSDWSALYQQNPIPDEGTLFKAEWLRRCDSLPDRVTLSVYGGSDFAVTPGGGDYTVHIVIGVDPHDKLYVLDHWRKQTSPHEWVAWCDLVKR